MKTNDTMKKPTQVKPSTQIKAKSPIKAKKITDKNKHNYVANLLLRRNLVAEPDRVWQIDLFTLPAKIKPPGAEPFDVKVLLVVDLASGMAILAVNFQVKNKGNVKSLLVFNQVRKLLTARAHRVGHEVDLIIHTDRGSEFTSAKFATLFNTIIQASMSNPNTPIDNAVVERLIRTLKYQLPDGGVWPKCFKSLAQANAHLQRRIKHYNEVHIQKHKHNMPPSQIDVALRSNSQNAPVVALHWNNQVNKYKDHIADDIISFKRLSAEMHKAKEHKQTIEIINSTHVHAKIASEAALNQPAVNDEFREQFASIKEAIGVVLATVTKPTKTRAQKRTQLPLRECANGDVYSFLMSLKRDGTCRFVWARNRVSATLLRWTGCRASDIAKLTLAQIQQAIKEESFQIIQPKTGAVRVIVLSTKAIIDLKAIHLDIAEVFDNNFDKPLASASVSNKLLASPQWLKSLNEFIKPAQKEFNLVLSSHSFRVNYITSLLRSVPLHRVSKLVGHANPNTTARYDRYVPDITEMKNHVDKIE